MAPKKPGYSYRFQTGCSCLLRIACLFHTWCSCQAGPGGFFGQGGGWPPGVVGGLAGGEGGGAVVVEYDEDGAVGVDELSGHLTHLGDATSLEPTVRWTP